MGHGSVRVALYSHDAQGLGHLRRNLAIAATLAADGRHDVLLISGTKEAGAFPTPRGVDVVALPALAKAADGSYGSRSLAMPLDAILELRAATIAAALDAFDPDVFVVDKLPLGVGGELRTALDRLRLRGRTRLVLGLRDVLDEPAVVRREWQRSGAYEVMRHGYDAIWVYGDPRAYDPVAEYGLDPQIAGKVRYTGYLGRMTDVLPDAYAYDIALCLVGGGQDGYALADAFARAELPGGTHGVIVAGPQMPAASREALHAVAGERPRMRVLDFVREPQALIAAARCAVAMGGYNTICELLTLARRTLVVPRVTPRREQAIRAERLSALGVIDSLHPDALVPEALSAWLAARPGPRVHPSEIIDLDGLSRLPGLLADVTIGLQERHAVAV